jgi:hypothetical protein
LGPGATVGVLGTGVPRLACLWPRAWHLHRPEVAHLHQPPPSPSRGAKPREGDSLKAPEDPLHQQLTSPSRGAKPREAGSIKTSGGSSSAGLAPEEQRILCKPLSGGQDDVDHDNHSQVGASGRRTTVSSLVRRGQGQAMESRGSSQRFPSSCNKTKTARTARRRSPPSPP